MYSLFDVNNIEDIKQNTPEQCHSVTPVLKVPSVLQVAPVNPVSPVNEVAPKSNSSSGLSGSKCV